MTLLRAEGCISITITIKQSDKDLPKTWEEFELINVYLAQLAQLMFIYNDGWQPDWEDVTEKQYCIEFRRNKPYKSELLTAQRFLAFKTEKIRDKFLENFEDLIWKAKPLMKDNNNKI